MIHDDTLTRIMIHGLLKCRLLLCVCQRVPLVDFLWRPAVWRAFGNVVCGMRSADTATIKIYRTRRRMACTFKSCHSVHPTCCYCCHEAQLSRLTVTHVRLMISSTSRYLKNLRITRHDVQMMSLIIENTRQMHRTRASCAGSCSSMLILFTRI